MPEPLATRRRERAQAIARHGSLEGAIAAGAIHSREDITVSEAVVLGLYRQNVRNYIGIFGHGSTDVAEVLRVYQEAGLVKTHAVRHETEAVHAATALRWVTGEKCAVITSIGPGALHALAGSLAPLSDGLGVWFLLGDETTQDEGPNMQQIPGHEQNRFHRLFSAMGRTYTLHTPEAVGTALRRGLAATEHPFRQEPFFLLLPMNVQPVTLPRFNFTELPDLAMVRPCLVPDRESLETAARAIRNAQRVLVKVGGGAKALGPELLELLELADAVAVHAPIAAGAIPASHPRNMTVGGSKGSLCGNFAMERADLLIALGTRFVCQSDCSRTGYPAVKSVININADPDTVIHYGKSIPLLGEIRETVTAMIAELKKGGAKAAAGPSEWLTQCQEKRRQWDAFREERYRRETLYDHRWQREVLTQPVVIKVASDWALKREIKLFFDAGDVQANGFQIVDAEHPGCVFTETGASYMGFAASALLATGMSTKPFYGLAFCGDGSFGMNPQILIDGIEHHTTGCILLLDNRRMGAISGLQEAQYGAAHATWDGVAVDYIAWAEAIDGVAAFDAGYSVQSLMDALTSAAKHPGLSLVYVRVYYGDDPLGGMGVFGRWNVGNWCAETQALRHDIGI